VCVREDADSPTFVRGKSDRSNFTTGGKKNKFSNQSFGKRKGDGSSLQPIEGGGFELLFVRKKIESLTERKRHGFYLRRGEGFVES